MGVDISRQEEKGFLAKKDLLFRLLKKIPSGKVVSYKSLALLLDASPRVIGRWLHQNPEPRIPCYRVVRKDGRLAPGYKFGGPKEQERKLRAEGVGFITSRRVAKNCFYRLPLIFFDIDDTLLVSREFKNELWRFLAKELELPPASVADLYRQFKRSAFCHQGLLPGFEKFLQQELKADINLREEMEIFFSLVERKFRAPSLINYLRYLEKDCLLGIFSRGDKFTQLRKLKMLGVREFFFSPLVLIDSRGKKRQAKRIITLANSGLFDIWVVDNEDFRSLFGAAPQLKFIQVRPVDHAEELVEQLRGVFLAD